MLKDTIRLKILTTAARAHNAWQSSRAFGHAGAWIDWQITKGLRAVWKAAHAPAPKYDDGGAWE